MKVFAVVIAITVVLVVEALIARNSSPSPQATRLRIFENAVRGEPRAVYDDLHGGSREQLITILKHRRVVESVVATMYPEPHRSRVLSRHPSVLAVTGSEQMFVQLDAEQGLLAELVRHEAGFRRLVNDPDHFGYHPFYAVLRSIARDTRRDAQAVVRAAGMLLAQPSGADHHAGYEWFGARGIDRHGIWIQWHDNGRVRSSGEVSHHGRTGPWQFWRADGSLEVAGTYRKDQREGSWATHAADGTVTWTEYFFGRERPGDGERVRAMAERISALGDWHELDWADARQTRLVRGDLRVTFRSGTHIEVPTALESWQIRWFAERGDVLAFYIRQMPGNVTAYAELQLGCVEEKAPGLKTACFRMFGGRGGPDELTLTP